MGYSRRLIHRAAVYRAVPPAGGRGPTGSTSKEFPSDPVEGLESVPCLFAPSDTRTIQRVFGRESELDGIVFFEGGTDIKPGITDAAGTNDKLVLTVKRGGAAIGTFLVQATKNPAFMGTMLVAGVRRVTK